MSKGNPYRDNRTKSKKKNKKSYTKFKNDYYGYKEDAEQKDLYLKKKQIKYGW